MPSAGPGRISTVRHDRSSLVLVSGGLRDLSIDNHCFGEPRANYQEQVSPGERNWVSRDVVAQQCWPLDQLGWLLVKWWSVR